MEWKFLSSIIYSERRENITNKHFLFLKLLKILWNLKSLKKTKETKRPTIICRKLKQIVKKKRKKNVFFFVMFV